MKVATVTWITYHNYGTQLQAYALQKYLISLGVETKIISDKVIIDEVKIRKSLLESAKKAGTCKVRNVPENSKKNTVEDDAVWSLVRKICIKVKNRIRKFKTKRRKRVIKQLSLRTANAIDSFIESHLMIENISSRNDLAKLNEFYDVFICGSDQIWSLNEDFDKYYFLNFTNKKKIAYAPSVGSSEINSDREEILKRLLANFDYLSVREYKTKEQLQRIQPKNVCWVSDPTLLFDGSHWRNETKNIQITKSNFVLCYFLENQQWYFDYASQISKYLGFKLVLIPNRPEYAIKKIVYKNPVGPLEFVKLFEKAEFILTDSYHGLLFSLNFNKQFIHFKRFSDDNRKSQNIRVYSILNYLDLDDLIVEKKEFEGKDLITVDYKKVNPKLDKFRNDSREYLNNSLFN